MERDGKGERERAEKGRERETEPCAFHFSVSMFY